MSTLLRLPVVVSFLLFFMPKSAISQSDISFTLVNSQTNLDIKNLADGDTLNLLSLPTTLLNVRVNTGQLTAASIEFILNGTSIRTESSAPFALAGDANGNYNPWTPATGTHSLLAIAYSGNNGSGTVMDSNRVNFTVVNATLIDCHGVLGGTAFIDDCGICSGGTTGLIPNADKDSCGVCFGNGSSCANGNAAAVCGQYPGGRIAIVSDGNLHDEDDWGATPLAVAMIDAAGLNDKLVFLGHSCHYESSDPNWEAEMEISSEGAALRFGMDTSIVYNVTQELSASIAALTAAINASSAADPLWISAGGPMDIIYQAIDNASQSKRQFVRLISHSSWNEDHEHFSGPPMHYTWSDMVSDFTQHGVQFYQILDQNNSNSGDDFEGSAASWQWMQTLGTDYAWLYNRNCLSCLGNFDVSDAGMTYWLISGGPGTGCETCGWAEVKDLFENPCTGNSSPCVADSIEITSTICAGDDLFGYTTSGVFIDTLVTSNGCDSIRELDLTVLPAYSTSVSVTLCQEDTANGYGTGGSYQQVFTAGSGCDSIHTTIFNILPLPDTTISATICSGTSLFGYASTGTFTDTLTSGNGCDSLRILNLQVLPPSQTYASVNICPGDSVNGYTSTGVYTTTFTGTNGCDSIHTLDLMVLSRPDTTINATICSGQNLYGYTTSGSYTDTLTASGGCQEIRYLNLSVLPSPDTTITATVCDGSDFMGYLSSGFYTDTLTSANGCDSILNLDLTVLPAPDTTIVADICAGETLEGYGISGSYTDVFTTKYGCDSTRTLHLQVHSLNTAVTLANNLLMADYTTADSYQWLECNSMLPVPGAVFSAFAPPANGMYAVEIEENGCIDTSSCIPFTALSDHVSAVPEVSVYPNPGNGRYRIDLGKIYPSVEIEVYDILGKRIRAQHVNQTAFIELLLTEPDGMYYLHLRMEETLMTFKLVKK